MATIIGSFIGRGKKQEIGQLGRVAFKKFKAVEVELDIHVTILPVNEYASYEHEHQLEVNLHLNNIYKKYILFSGMNRTDMLLVYLFICTALVGDQVEVEAC